jgi:hypothetical protein
MLPRCLVRGGLPVDVAASAGAAPGCNVFRTVFHDVAQALPGLGIVHFRPAWYLDYAVGSVPAAHTLPTSVACMSGTLMGRVVYLDQGVDVMVGPQDDVTAFTTIAPVRPPLGDKTLAPDMYDPVTAVSRLGVKHHGIDKSTGFHDRVEQAGLPVKRPPLGGR